MRLKTVIGMSCLVMDGLVMSSIASAASTPASISAATTIKETHIAPQPLAQALEQFARSRQFQLIYATEEISALHSAGAEGQLSASETLQQLLQGTGLTYRFLDDKTVTVQPAASMLQKTTLNQPSMADNQAQPAARYQLAQASEAPRTATVASFQLEEVVVTAQKKEERLQEVPIPLVAVTGADLAEKNFSRLQDYSAQIPGLSITSNDSAGAPMLAVRGIAPAAFGNPTVGIMVNDVPMGSSTALGGGFVSPELDPDDLARIEVLRGPQGTLYGAASMGGLFKYVTVDPVLERFQGRAKIGFSRVSHGEKTGYNLSGAVNMPIGETVAVRASGFTRVDPGYADNIQSGQKDTNETHLKGGMLAALWQPSDDFSVKLSAMTQHNELRGFPYMTIEPGFGDLQYAFRPNSGQLKRQFNSYSAIVSATLGQFDLVSVTGYNRSDLDFKLDNTSNLGDFMQANYPTPDAVEHDAVKTNKFTQEVRLTTHFGDAVEWLLGGFYTHEKSPSLTEYYHSNANADPLELYGRFDAEAIYSEASLFTDVTVHFTDQFDVQVGGREARSRQKYSSVDTGQYVIDWEGESVPISEGIPNSANKNAFTYLVTPRYKITPDMMVYARFASGFRPGGVNIGFLAPDVPRDFKPDTTENYEIGLKGDLADHRVSYDASLYYIDWKDIQQSLLNPGSSFSYYSNGGRAKSQGIEFSVQAKPIESLQMGFWVTWNQAVLSENNPEKSTTYGQKGDRLPFSSRFSSSANVAYSIPVGSAMANVGGTVTYVGSRVGAFQPKDEVNSEIAPERQLYPAYTTVDLTSGLRWERWSTNVYLNNVFDRRGLVGGGIGSYFPTTFDVVQPRNMGISFSRSFE